MTTSSSSSSPSRIFTSVQHLHNTTAASLRDRPISIVCHILHLPFLDLALWCRFSLQGHTSQVDLLSQDGVCRVQITHLSPSISIGSYRLISTSSATFDNTYQGGPLDLGSSSKESESPCWPFLFRTRRARKTQPDSRRPSPPLQPQWAIFLARHTPFGGSNHVVERTTPHQPAEFTCRIQGGSEGIDDGVTNDPKDGRRWIGGM
jgi:hypothetical protein